MKILKAALLSATLAAVSSAHAITFTFSSIEIGGDPAAFTSTSYGILVVDTAGDGFQAIANSSLLLNATSAAAGSFLGSDDLVFLITTQDGSGLNLLNFGGGDYVFSKGLTNVDTATYSVNWTSGDSLGLFWFPSGTSTAGSSFNFYRSNSVGDGTIGFSTPGAGNTNSLINDSTAVGGSTPLGDYTTGYPSGSPLAGGFSGSITAIPEPGSVAFLITAGLAFLVVGRRIRRGSRAAR